VVTPYGKQGLVHIADTANEFIEAAEKIFNEKNKEEWMRKVDTFLSNISWNKTWNRMSLLIEEALGKKAIVNNNKSKVYV
jgi:UDP-galactopyranose mutase